jgi:hypothetical protein
MANLRQIPSFRGATINTIPEVALRNTKCARNDFIPILRNQASCDVIPAAVRNFVAGDARSDQE